MAANNGPTPAEPIPEPSATPSPRLDQLRQRLAEGVPTGQADEDTVRRQWWAALATLQDHFLANDGQLRGLWLAAPLPALYEPRLLNRLPGWVWAPPQLEGLLDPGAPLLPAVDASPAGSRGFQRLPLAPDDGTDPLLLVITPALQVALALHGPPQARSLVVRFDPPTLSAALSLVDQRLQREAPDQALALRASLQELGSLHSDDQIAGRFWPRLAERLASMAPSVTLQPLVHGGGAADGSQREAISRELALLEALTHEVRTPLATIRTLIRSLLRRSDLSALVRQRLEQIDGECSEQIDRFGLIFHAAELQRQPATDTATGTADLARTDLSALLEQLRPSWERQLERRGLRLELHLNAGLPEVLSNPSRLETMLGGLMDRFSRGLPSGAGVLISLQPAGARLKLRLSSEASTKSGREGAVGDRDRSIEAQGPTTTVGPVLSWNPTTGSLQLSRQATQRLFHSLGGRLTERHGNGLTVFFPLA
ncbi:MAG: sensor histidine kinase [Cyanobacteriota bacterium]